MLLGSRQLLIAVNHNSFFVENIEMIMSTKLLGIYKRRKSNMEGSGIQYKQNSKNKKYCNLQ